ncbi:hypothetical protein Tco_0868786 [Tanacetum coccineum]
MPPKMTTQSAGRQTAAPRGERIGGRTRRGGGGNGEPTGRVGGRTSDQDGQGDLLPTIIAQVGNHASNIQGDVKSVNVNNGRNGCSYKEFMACSPKDYDEKGGTIAYTCWIENGISPGYEWVLMRKEFCPNNEMQKLETEFGSTAMVKPGHAAYTIDSHKLA